MPVPFSSVCRVSAVAAAAMGLAVATAAELSYRSHWLGHAGSERPLQTNALGLAVTADGTCVVSSTTEAEQPTVALYRDGQLVGRSATPSRSPHTFTGAVAASEKFLLAAVELGPAPAATTQPPEPDATAGPPAGTTWHGLWRFTHDGQHAPFPGGRSAEMAMLVLSAVPAPTDAASHGSPVIAGVCIHEGEVFVSDRATGRIRVYDESTLTEKRSFRASEPAALCVLAGTLQVVERGAVVTAYTLEGRRTGQVLDEGDDLLPGSLAPTPEGRLMISDRGPGQQIHFFNMSGVPTRVRTLGEENGVYGPPAPGEVGPRRLANITGVGTDAQGNLYVTMNPPPGGFVLRSFNPDRKSLRWQVTALPTADGADCDPHSDGLDLYTAEGRHALDLNQPPGQSWRWVAQTVNPFRYPGDPRLTPRAGSGTTTFRELEGKKFLVHRPAHGRQLDVYRLEGQTATPALSLSDDEKSTTAPPALGRLASSPMDSRGGLWRVSAEGVIHHWPCRGLDDRGLPVYDPEPATSTPAPAGFTGPFALHYDAPNDGLYLAGLVSSSATGAITHVLRFDGWSARGATTPRWTTTLPVTPGHSIAPALAAAGDLVFVLDPATAQIQVLDARQGGVVGTLGLSMEKPRAVLPTPTTTLQAHRRKDGTYLVYTQDPTTRRSMVHHLDDPSGGTRSK